MKASKAKPRNAPRMKRSNSSSCINGCRNDDSPSSGLSTTLSPSNGERGAKTYAKIHTPLALMAIVGLLLAVLPHSGPAWAFSKENHEPLAEAPGGTFTIAVIPDTQRYLGPASGRGDETGESRNPAFESRTRWLAENLQNQRIVFVSHVGDIVDRNTHTQWRLARANMDRFHGRVPYGISVGNHDMTSAGDSSLFQEYFGAERYSNMDWYGGTYAGRLGQPAVSGNNANSFQLFSAGGIDFVFFHLECNAPDDVLEWADSVLERHRDRLALVTTHMYLGPIQQPVRGQDRWEIPLGRMHWKKVHGDRGNTPEQMWQKSFRKHPNLLLVLSGDQSGTIACRQVSIGEQGNTVYEVMQDYPRNNDESDWIRLYRFDPDKMKIRVWTYSPVQDRLCDGVGRVTDRGEHQFVLDISDALERHQRIRAEEALLSQP
jgi:hypothetical protein